MVSKFDLVVTVEFKKVLTVRRRQVPFLPFSNNLQSQSSTLFSYFPLSVFIGVCLWIFLVEKFEVLMVM
jgi:hypothetical protein